MYPGPLAKSGQGSQGPFKEAMLTDIWGDCFFSVYACVGCVPMGVWKPEEDARCPLYLFLDYSLDIEALTQPGT